MTIETKATWHNLDPASLPKSVQDSYITYKALYAKAKEARATFEAAVTSSVKLPKEHRMIFGYNFGKLSVAIVPDDKPAAEKAPRMTLAAICATAKSA